jgi:hypothetical protein
MPAQVSFIRKTSLAPNEYQADFTITDNGIIDALTSQEALAVTALMPAIYFRLKRAPRDCWEREGVLRLTGSVQGRELTTAWVQLRHLSGVSNSTLSKALKWLHESGVIGYDARKNGIGIRIFFNRAAASIRRRDEQKNLRLIPAPTLPMPAPSNGATFKEHVSEEELDIYEYPSAPAEKKEIASVRRISPSIPPETNVQTITNLRLISLQPPKSDTQFLASLVRQTISELRPEIAATAKREHENTREWLLKYALPKAARVAQRETYDLLRTQGGVTETSQHSGKVGGNGGSPAQSGEGRSITSFLTKLSLEFGKLAERSETASEAGETVLPFAYREAERGLHTLHDRLLRCESLSAEEIDQSLAAIEETLAEALWEATNATDRETLLEEAKSQLRNYRVRMEEAVFNDTVRRQVTSKLRERHRVPRVNLLYL